MHSQVDLARSFTSLHVSGAPLVLPNAWDVASARVVAAAGARAVATTSAGVAWAHGSADGHRLPRRDGVEAIAEIARAVDVPVTADVEDGFGESATDVARTVAEVIEAGAVGQLASAGAHRVSAGSSIAEAAYSLVGEMAATMLGDSAATPGPAPTLGWSALNALAETR